MTKNVTANKKHKDRLFRFLFREKASLLALYNAINGTSYDNPEELTTNTLEDVMIMGIKNDVSFIVGDTMNLYEHQSTFNPNMPLRGLFYLADLYHGYVAEEKLDIYSSSIVPLPFPKYVVFYNGEADRPEREVLKLSGSYYPQNEEPALELTCILLNINQGYNRELMEKCPLLGEYATLIAYVRKFTSKGYQLEEAVKRAMDVCIKENVLADFLRKHREEIFHMLLKESDWEFHVESEQKLWFAKGEEAGFSKGEEAGFLKAEHERAKSLVKNVEAIMQKFHVDLKETCDTLGITVEEYDRAKKKLSNLA